MKVLFCAVDRIEGIVVPDVPTHGYGRLRCLHRFVNRRVGFAQAIGPQHFPSGQFRIAQQQPPELDVVTVHWAFAIARGANEFFQLEEPLAGALYIDAALFRFVLTKLAKTGDLARIDRWHIVRECETVAKCALPLRSPHDSIYVVGTRIVLHQASQEIPVIGIIDAQRVGVPPVQVAFLYLLDVRQVRAEYILQPAYDFHAALFCCRENFGEDVEVSVVRGASLFENGILVVLSVGSGEISTMKIEIVLLLAMIGQWLARNLPSRDATTVGENREKQCVYAGSFLKHIQNFFGAFIDKGNRSNLDADHFRGDLSIA